MSLQSGERRNRFWSETGHLSSREQLIQFPIGEGGDESFPLGGTVQVEMPADPGATAWILKTLNLGDDDGFCAALHRSSRGEIEARRHLPPIRRNLRPQIQFRRTGAGYVRKAQAQ